jgi:hypothetical protein
MRNRWIALAAGLSLVLVLVVACEDGIDDWNSSARVSGDVFTGPDHAQGIAGVQVVIESDMNSDQPYEGPDRWTRTDGRGHFDGAVFLGHTDAGYNYIADLSVQYFYNNKRFVWSGGITVGPGSTFTLPAVDTTMFVPLSGE